MGDNFSGLFVENVRNFRQFYGTFGYKGLSLMKDDFSGPFVQNIRNFRQV